MSIFNRKNSGNKRVCEQSDSDIEYISQKQIIPHSEEKDEEIIQKIPAEIPSNSKFPTGDKSADLMILIGKALDEWAKMYHLQGMPKKVVFGQALALMTAWYKDLK